MGLFGKMLEYSRKPLIMSGNIPVKPFVCNESSAHRRFRASDVPALLFGYSLVQIEDHASHGSPGRQLPGVQFAVEFGLTHVQQPLRPIWIMMIAGYFVLGQVPQNLPLFSRG